MNQRYVILRVICRLVHLPVIHPNDWYVLVRFIAGIVLVCWVALLGLHADRAPAPVRQVGRAVSVVVFWPRRIHLCGTFGTTSPSSISKSVSLNRCLCSSMRSLRPTSSSSCLPCQIGAILVDGLTGFSSVTRPACENQTLVAIRLLQGFLLPTDRGRRTRSAAACTSCYRWSCFARTSPASGV